MSKALILRLSLLLIHAILWSRTLGTECFHARSALPITSHCYDLIKAIEDLSRLPGENDLKAWGRGLPTGEYSQNLPKSYWIGGRGPSTCAVHVDVNPLNEYAVDSFRQSSVALSAERVVNQCLDRQGLIGLSYPLGAEHVYTMVVRTDSPWVLNTSNTHGVRNISLPGAANVLQVAGGSVGIS